MSRSNSESLNEKSDPVPAPAQNIVKKDGLFSRSRKPPKGTEDATAVDVPASEPVVPILPAVPFTALFRYVRVGCL